MTAVTAERVRIPVWRVVRAAWFRNRLTVIAVLAVFAAAAGSVVYLAMSMRSWLAAHQMLQCTNPAVNPGSSRCSSTAWYDFIGGFRVDQGVYVLIAMPAVVAMFGGVRWLTREYETGSFRYSWTQDVSRLRWLVGTLVPLLVVAAVGALACGLAFNLWFAMGQWLTGTNTMGGPWDWNSFPLTPLTFTALVLAGLGVATLAAALIRRTVPAMIATVVVSGLITYLADLYLRPWLLGLNTVTTRVPFDFSARAPDGGYFLRGWLTDSAGHVIPGFAVTRDGGLLLPASGWMNSVVGSFSTGSVRRYLAAHHYSYWTSYQPHNHLLLIQAAWAVMVLAIGAVALGLAIWRTMASR